MKYISIASTAHTIVTCIHMYVCMYVCMYAYIYIYMYVYIYIYTHGIHVCVYTYTHTYTHEVCRFPSIVKFGGSRRSRREVVTV